jgi:hypothetical protein
MEIKPASNPKDSQSLRGLRISDGLQLTVIVLSMIGGVIFYRLPIQTKAEVGQYAFAALTAGGVATKLLNGSIKEGRLELGDLAERVTNYALLNSPEAATRLQAVSGFIETGVVPSATTIIKTLQTLEQKNKDS